MNGQIEIGDISPGKLFVCVSAVLGLLFAFIAESDRSFAMVLIQWQLQTSVAVIVVLYSHLTLVPLFLKRLSLNNPWMLLSASGVLGSFIFTPIALMSDISLGGESDTPLNFTSLANEFVAISPPITIAWLAMNAPWVLGFRLKARDDESAHSPERVLAHEEAESGDKNLSAEQPEFLKLTSLKNAGNIDYMKAELHYISVVAGDQKELILYSLAEAAEQLEKVGIEGSLCHRSYWVALKAVDQFQKRGRQAVIITHHQDTLPVSRNRVKSLEKLISLKTDQP